MIQSLNNFSKKSWDNYSTENDFFNSRNIVFGKNGMGKTALGQGIIEEYTKRVEINLGIIVKIIMITQLLFLSEMALRELRRILVEKQ